MLPKKLIQLVKQTVTRFVLFPPPSDRLIDKAATLIAWSRMEGDYAEFGVWRGDSIVRAVRAFQKAYADRIAVDRHINSAESSANDLKGIWTRMKFFAFDSFEGLPRPRGVDLETNAFRCGDFASGIDQFNHLVHDSLKSNSDRVVPVKGWFEETCVPKNIERLHMRSLAVVHIDCDLYESARAALKFVEPMLQDGTILIFDDWYCYRGHPDRGEQKAFREWSEAVKNYTFVEYMKGECSANSFICCVASQ